MLRGAIRGSGGSGQPQQNVAEIIQLLESNNVSVIEEATALVRDSFTATSDPWLLNGLVDYYVTSGNVVIRRLLTGVRPPQHKHLLAKLEEYLQKQATRIVALNLFGHVVRKEPSWIHNVVQSRAFATVIKCLQLDNDIAAVTVAMYLVSTLLPKAPTQISRHLNHLFGIYVRLVSWKTVRGNDCGELNTINFDTALFSLFLCLYDMYPCGFLWHLQQYYSKTKSPNPKVTDAQNIELPATTPVQEQILMERKRHEIFKTSVAPMMRQVRLNPNLILYTKDLEVLSEKWRKFETYDIVAEMSRISIESDYEKLAADCNSGPTRISGNESVVESGSFHGVDTSGTSSALELDTEMMAIWSPSMEIGLSTPPLSRGITPTCELSEDKSRSDSVEKSSAKLKFRPDSLTLSHGSLKGSNVSTPCTPTMPSLSFEYEKGEGFLPSENTANASSGNDSEVSTFSGASKNEFDFLTSSAGQNAPTSPSGCSNITDFSPALQPSVDHLSGSKSAENKPNISAEPFFIPSEKPTVKDILGLDSADSLRNLSSSNLLSKELQYSVQTISQKPDTDIDWLHFGQGPLSEKDSRSLRAAYLQANCALSFERHRRQQHEMRARRLMRRVRELSADEERSKAVKDTLSQKENEVAQLQALVDTMRSDFARQDKSNQNSVEILNKQSSQLARTLRSTKEENATLKLEKAKHMAELKKAVDGEKECKAELYNCKLRLEAEERNKETNEELKAQIFQLQKEMLVVEELSRKMNDLEENEWKFKVTKTAEHEMLIQSYKTETERLRNDLKRVHTVRDAMAGKVKEMEKMVEKKNRLIDEQKKYLENVKSLARGQIQAIESKYQAQKASAMQMEVKLMEVFSKLSAIEGQASGTISRSESKPIEQPPSNAQYRRYGDLQEVSPEFSPPMKVSMMEDESVATAELEASAGSGE